MGDGENEREEGEHKVKDRRREGERGGMIGREKEGTVILR